jgi:F0F1-type ATP synthase membrane subunit b/b'
MQEEINVIKHLLAVEKESASLIDDAVKEADSRTTQARNQANSQFKQKYEEIAASLQNEYEHTLENKKSEHAKQMTQFETQLNDSPRNYEEFNKVLNGILGV